MLEGPTTVSSEKRVLPTPQQVRAARGLLEWTQADLAQAAGVGVSTIERYERRERELQEEIVVKIAEAFERRGIVFTNGGKPTVSLDPDRAVYPV